MMSALAQTNGHEVQPHFIVGHTLLKSNLALFDLRLALSTLHYSLIKV